MNNILVIGNGFDKAHGLKTSYSDFINFYVFVTQIDGLIVDDMPGFKKDVCGKLNIEYSDKQLELLKNTFTERKTIDDIQNNLWFNIIKECAKHGDKWSDLEHFIGISMKCLCRIENTNNTNVFELDDYNYYSEEYDVLDEELNKLYNSNPKSDDYLIIRELSKNYIDDFKTFSRYLGLYLKEFLNDNDNKIENFIVISKNYDYVLSFNYTQTFQKKYGKNEEDIHYIHGSIDDITKLVFGTDTEIECVIDERKLAYESFRKYFQRIVYKTGNKYKNWLNNTSGHILFYGFSFAMEDKKVIKELVDSGKKIFIFYLNDQALADIVKNLSIILTEEKLIELTGSNKIVFINDLEDEDFQKEIDKYKKYLQNIKYQKEKNEKLDNFYNYGID